MAGAPMWDTLLPIIIELLPLQIALRGVPAAHQAQVRRNRCMIYFR
jgi:hypothetical protein